MPFETSPLRLWKSLARADREEAAEVFWRRPPEDEGAAAAQAIIDVLRVRPQAFGKVPFERRVRTLAGLASPPESVAEALLIALHVDSRRQLLIDFLDAAGIAHENGLLDDDEVVCPDADTLRAAGRKLLESHPPAALRVYWNALWLQDPERWGALEMVAAEL